MRIEDLPDRAFCLVLQWLRHMDVRSVIDLCTAFAGVDVRLRQSRALASRSSDDPNMCIYASSKPFRDSTSFDPLVCVKCGRCLCLDKKLCSVCSSSAFRTGSCPCCEITMCGHCLVRVMDDVNLISVCAFNQWCIRTYGLSMYHPALNAHTLSLNRQSRVRGSLARFACSAYHRTDDTDV